MKKFLVCALLAAALTFTLAASAALPASAPLLGAPSAVHAGEVSLPPYGRVTKKNTYLYANPDSSRPLFALAVTYYVKILGIEGEFYRVELLEDTGAFTRLNGYVYVSSLASVLSVPVAPLYPMQTITVSESSAKLYLSPGGMTLCSLTYSQRMGYFGNIFVGGVEYYYVSYGDYLGYVESRLVTTPNIPNHPTPLETPTPVIPEPEPEPTDPDPGKTGDKPGEVDGAFDGAQLVLILLITIPSLVIVFVLFSPAAQRLKREGGSTLKERSVATATQKNIAGNSDKQKPKYYDDFI